MAIAARMVAGRRAPARAGRRAHAVCGRERPREALREIATSAAGDAHRADGRVDARPGARHGVVEPRVRGTLRHVARRYRLSAARACSRGLRPEDRSRLPRRSSKRALASAQDYQIEFEFQHARTGEWRWMEARGRAEYGADGKPTRLYGLGDRHHRSAARGRGAAGSGSPQGRIPGDAGARAAQSARADQLRPAHPAHRAQSPSSRATALAIMERQVGQMVRLVDDLLDVARITTGKVDLRCEPLDLAVADPRRRRDQRAGARPAGRGHGRRRRRAGVRQRRSHAARAGVRQPAEQQRQVQRAGPADLDRVRARGR